MTCQDMMDLMQRSLDLDLSAAEEQVLLAHMQSCPGCADLHERLTLLNGELVQLPKVAPPYSIVDSILPQLEELGGLVEPGAAADPAPVRHVDEVAARREKKGLISWKIVSGVAAAGIVFGAFVFNLGPGNVDNKTAQEAAETKAKNSADATVSSGGAPEAYVMDTAGANPAVSPKEQVPSPAASTGSGQAEATLTPTNTGQQSATPPRDGRQVSAASGERAQPTQGPFKVKDQYGSGFQEPKQSPLAQYELQKQFNDATALKTSPTPAPDGQKELAAADPTPEAKAGSSEEEKFGIASIPVQELAPSPGGMELGDTARGFATSAKSAPAAIQPMTSPDGAYSAQLMEHSVAILGKDGQELFRSGVQLTPGDILTFKGWSEGNLFTYSLKKPDGTETVYRISVADKKETVQ